MTLHDKADAHLGAEELAAEMMAIGAAARDAARAMREAGDAAKTKALREAAKIIRSSKVEILAANVRDLDAARAGGMAASLLDRLALNDARIEAMAKGVEEVAAQPDPNGRELARWSRPNGLDIARVATPIGVIGIIYESRPNVTADAAAIALKAGNVAILRGGSDSVHSAGAIHAAMAGGLKAAGLPQTAVQYVKNTDRAAVGLMLEGLNGTIDLIIPRGGKGLTGRVMREARVPVLAHLEGICHVYVHDQAELAMARKVVLNAKMRRTSICGAAETLLLDAKILASHGLPILEDLAAAGCEIRGDARVRGIYPAAKPATEEDWKTEYLDAIIAVKVVEGVEEAISHIETHGSHHTDSIITEDAGAAEEFLSALDSAIVLWNASTQFADGGEFGMGAEIGIGTGKLHARGPVGVEQLTTFKYVVRGNGQTPSLNWIKPPGPVAEGLSIGLLGGSFNPAHGGHRYVALTALKKLKLDYVWLLVSPGNPLKDGQAIASFATRLAGARVMARHPRLIVSDIERQLGTRYSVDTIARLKRRFPGVCFVWLMGSDNLKNFHLWRNWQTIARSLPLAVVQRPGSIMAAVNAAPIRHYGARRFGEMAVPADPPAILVLDGARNSQSATQLRTLGG